MDVESLNRDVLRIGDLISLKLPKSDEWLCADGILDQVYACKNPEYIEDVLWEVYVQNQYNCAKDFKETAAAGTGNSRDPSKTDLLLEQLKNAEINEMSLNKKLMIMKVGKPVAFGDIVQLKHMKSKKMLTVLDTVLAKSERENMRIVLSNEGDSLSWLELIPRHKYDHEGQLITDHAELYIRVRERPGEYVHSAKKMALNDPNREINSSLDNTSWSMYVYQHAPEPSSRDIMAGQLITLQEVELSSYITLDHCSPGITREAYVVVSPMTQLSNVAADCNIGTGMLWMVEKKDFFHGGELNPMSGKLSLRHFNSGLFMKIGSGGAVTAVVDRADASYFDFVVSQSSDGSNSLQEGCSVQLREKDSWLSLHRSGSERRCIPTKDKTQALSLILSHKTYRLFETEIYLSLECCRRMRVFEELVDDNSWQETIPAEHMLKSLFSVLQTLIGFLTRDKMDTSAGSSKEQALIAIKLAPTESLVIRQTIVKEQGVLDVLMDLLQSSEADAFRDLGSAVPLSESPIRLQSKRYSGRGLGFTGVSQRDLKESDVFASAPSSRASSYRSLTVSRKGSERFSSKAVGKKNSASENVCHEILDTLFYCLLHNHDNKMYIADRFPVLLKQIKLQQAAVLCVKEILRNNLQLVQTKVREREMAIFLDLVTNTEMNPTLLSLLQATCSCPMGVDSTQRMIVLALYNNIFPTSGFDKTGVVDGDDVPDDFQVDHTRSKVIDIVIDPMIVKQTNWVENVVYMPPASSGSNPAKEILGYELVEKGLPRLHVIWEQDAQRDDFSMKNLFNYPRKVPFEIICNVLDGSVSTLRRGSVSLSSKKNKSSVKRRRVSVEAALKHKNSNFRRRRSNFEFEGGSLNSIAARSEKVDPPTDSMATFNRMAVTMTAETNQKSIREIMTGRSHAKIYAVNNKYYPSTTTGAWDKLRSLFPKPENIKQGSTQFRRRVSKASSNRSSAADRGAVGSETSSNSRQRSVQGNRVRRQSSFNQLAAVQRMKKNAGNQHAKGTEEMRLQFVDYFIAQLYLAADLCLDRNYVAIGILESRLPYTLLLAMLKAPYIPHQLKAPVCRILRCLHIDRDPQVPMRLPRLIRTSISLNGGDETDKAPSCQFALIQQIISEYVNSDLDTTSCDELSTEMISLLESLMQFGFYATSSQLQDVVNPLVQVLDDHRAIGWMMAAANKVAKKVTPTTTGIESADFSVDSGDDPVVDSAEPSLSASIKKFQEMGLAKEKKPLFFVQWYRSLVDFIEDSDIYDRIAEYFESDEKDGRFGFFESNVEDMWEFKVLDMLESIKALYVILTVVIVVSLLALLRVFQTIQENSIYAIFDLAVSASFITELALRMFCFFRVHKKIIPFFKNGLNVLDFIVVAFDIVMISLGASAGLRGVEIFAKTLRIVRIIRIFRIIRAARLLSKIAEKSSGGSEWEFPSRYLSVTEHEAKTIAGILRVLSLINLRIQDRQLSIVIKAFVQWYDSDMSGIRRDPIAVYEEVCSMRHENADHDAYLPQKLDDVLLDIIMYSDTNLVEEALRLLMVHKSQTRLLLEATARIQIISTPKVEAKYAELTQLLLKLNRAAEAFEVWGALNTDEDMKEAQEVSNCLTSIINLIRVQSNPQVLDLSPLYTTEVEVQQLLLNLDAVTTIIQFQYALCDGTLETPHPEICSLLRKSNDIIKWFVADNAENQAAAFKNIDWFMHTLPLGVDSSLAVRSIVWGNKVLAKECPRKYISDCLSNFVDQTKNPDYLDLLVGVTHISDVGDSGILSIRNEIALHLSHTDSRELQWCSGPDSHGYTERLLAMKPFLNKNPPPEDHELSPELRFHINYIMLLSGCKLGPKLQAMYQVDDIVAAIIDPGTIFNVKIALGNLLSQSVTTGMNNLDASEGMWQFLQHVCEYYETDQTELPHLFRRYDRIPLRTQKAAWYQVANDIIYCFFSEFNFNNFNDASSFEQDGGSIVTKLSESEAKLLVHRLSDSIRTFLQKNSKVIGNYFNESMKGLLEVLANILDVEIATAFLDDQPHVIARKNVPIRRNSVADEIQQVFYKKQFQTFIEGLASGQNNVHRAAVEMFEKMPSVNDHVNSDIRLEPFITKVTTHIRSRVKRYTTACALDKSSLDSTVWILQTLRLVLEKTMDHTIYTIMDPHEFGGTDSPHVIELQNTFNDCGVTDLCLDLISVGIDQDLCIQAVMLLVCLLARSGGNIQCQKKVYNYLIKADSTLFFEEVKELIEQQILWCQHDAESKADMGTEHSSVPQLPEQIVVLKLISLLCEGNYMPNKNILREQDGNMRHVNILGCLVEYTKLISRSETPNCTNAAIRVVKAIVALLQGPCFGNQEYFVLHSDLLAALNRILRSTRPFVMSEEWDTNFELLKEYVVDVLRACIEARPQSSTVIERVSSVVESNVLNVLLFAESNSEKKDLTYVQANYLVFLQTLHPDDKDKPAHIKSKTSQNIASVEVIWNNVIHRHYFPVPDIASGISSESKNELLENVEFSNQEGRLKDFMTRSRKLFREAIHYQRLASYGLSNAWIVKEKLTWLMLINAIVMNSLLVTYYDGSRVDRQPQQLVTVTNELEADYIYHNYVNEETTMSEEDQIWIADTPNIVLYWLNVGHIIAAAIVFALVVLLRSPVIYQCAMELDGSRFKSLFKVFTDPLPLWYCTHFTLAVISLLFSHFVVSLLLFEFVAIDSATKDVLFTVINPARQLGVTVIIIMILTQVFSCVTFLYYRDQFLFLDCFSMWDSFKIGVSYGARAEEGIGKYMIGSIDDRMILDMIFYFSICVILRNCFFGIVIDTFGSLRNKKMDRETDQNEICFICGLDKHEVDKRTSRNTGSGFTYHRQEVHNIWNYLFFAVRIWNQHSEEDTGVELHVRKCIMAGDISWLPIGVTGAANDCQNEDKKLIKKQNAKDGTFTYDAHDANITDFAFPKSNLPDCKEKRDGRRDSNSDSGAVVAMKAKRASIYPGEPDAVKTRNLSLYRKLSTIKVQLQKLEQSKASTPLMTPVGSFNHGQHVLTHENRDPKFMGAASTFQNNIDRMHVLASLSELDVDFGNIQRRLSAIVESRFADGIPSAIPSQTPEAGDIATPFYSSFEALSPGAQVTSAVPIPSEQGPRNPEDNSPRNDYTISGNETEGVASNNGSFGEINRNSRLKSVDPEKPLPNEIAKQVSAKVLRDMYYKQNTSSSMMMSFSHKRSMKGPSMKQAERIIDRGDKKSNKHSFGMSVKLSEKM